MRCSTCLLFILALLASACDGSALGGEPTFQFDLEEGVEKTMEGDGYAEVRCGFATCTERFVFEDSGESLYLATVSSPNLSSVSRTITFGRSNGTRGRLELDGFGVSLDVDGRIEIECAGDRVRGSIALVASFNERPGEPVQLTGVYDMPRTADDSWGDDPLPECR